VTSQFCCGSRTPEAGRPTHEHSGSHPRGAGQEGWRLSPAYDLNPIPVDIKPRILTTAINENDGTASLDLAMSVAEYFELEKDKAKAIAAEVGKTVSKWRDEAAVHGIGKSEIDRMASAFEHDDLKMAQRK
jgi:serine/threonine-protein kinase HipA